MKAIFKKMRHFFPLLLSLFVVLSVEAQEENRFYTISGIIKDAKTKKKIEYVNVSAVGTSIGTISNEDGEFTFKISNALRVSEIEFSCLGYFNARVSFSGEDMIGQTFLLTSKAFPLSEVEVVSWSNPRQLIETAVKKVEKNYSSTPNLLTGFYRETVQKGRKYINVSEAVIQVYKTPYSKDIGRDRVQVLKGRRLLSPNMKDTLSVKLLGGPYLSIYMDVIKNPELILDPVSIDYYRYKMEEMTSINDRIQYVVSFTPQYILDDHPLFHGLFYIDRETLAFTRIDFQMEMRDKDKVTAIILRNKPSGLRFTPNEVSYVVNYRQEGGKTYLNYVRNEIKFKCDWKRKLFGTNYTVVSEMVVTDIQKENVIRISNKDSFSERKSLSSEIMTYFDKDFWGAYNIIEPTESLESAIPKLKKEAFDN